MSIPRSRIPPVKSLLGTNESVVDQRSNDQNEFLGRNKAENITKYFKRIRRVFKNFESRAEIIFFKEFLIKTNRPIRIVRTVTPSTLPQFFRHITGASAEI